MRKDTVQRKKAMKGFREVAGDEWLMEHMYRVMASGKLAFDSLMRDLGQMMAESIMLLEREEISGPDYSPVSSSLRKWASESSSVYLGDQKIRVARPRLRNVDDGVEVPLNSYQKMRQPEGFSSELLAKIFAGISARKYEETVVESAKAFGVSPSSISRKTQSETVECLRAFKERALTDFSAFAIFLDTIHRGGRAFIVALGVDTDGKKMALGFFEGATENHEICDEVLADLERRSLVLHKRILFITDGGKGIIKSLKNRFGNHLVHQRCTIHKDRNIQKHLPKRYRAQAHQQFRIALEQKSYDDAKKMLHSFERWLRAINESAADSLLEAIGEILTLHRLKITGDLRKVLCSTNPIESMFSSVRHCERNIKRYRSTNMAQRWLAASLLHSEKSFRRVKGFRDIAQAIKNIDAEQCPKNDEMLMAA